MAYLTTGGIHTDELQIRLRELHACVTDYEAAVKVWMLEPWSDKPSDDALAAIQNILVTACAQQTALLETLGDGYSADAKALLWDALAVELEQLRLCTIGALRLICRWSKDEDVDAGAVSGFVEKASSAADLFKHASQRHLQSKVLADDRSLAIQLVDMDEILRAFFAQLAVRQLATLTADLHSALLTANIFAFAGRWRSSFFRNVAAAIWDQCSLLCRSSEYFKMGPADAILDACIIPPLRVRARRHCMYPLRLTLCAHTATLLLIALGKEFPAASEYIFWALLPCILCFLPTTGAVVLKSLRRALGTIFGGLASFACLTWSANNPEAFLMQCFIITFLAKYSSQSKFIDYGGITFGLTWHVVVLSTYNSYDTKFSYALVVASWRIGMTLAGTILAVIGSLVLFPTHATVEFEHRSAEALLCTTEVCVLATQDTLAEAIEIDNADTISTGAKSEGSTGTAVAATPIADLEAYIRSSALERRALLTEGEAERWLVQRKIANMSALHDASTALVSIASAIQGCSLACTAEERGAARHFLSDASRHGRVLKHSIAKVHEALRNATLGLALRLRGVRAPHGKTSEQQLRRAVRLLQRSFMRARLELITSGEMPSLVSQGLDRFYAQIHGLCKYSEEWLNLEKQLLHSKVVNNSEKVGTRGPEHEKEPAGGGDEEEEQKRGFAHVFFKRGSSLDSLGSLMSDDDDYEIKNSRNMGKDLSENDRNEFYSDDLEEGRVCKNIKEAEHSEHAEHKQHSL